MPPKPKAKPKRAAKPRPLRATSGRGVEHRPTQSSRRRVLGLARLGLPQAQIALLIGISEPTLRKHYEPELARGEAEATEMVAKTLFHRATKGNDLSAAIFWMKARAGWSEKRQPDVVKHEGNVQHEHSGEVQLMTPEQRAAVIAAVRARAKSDDDDDGSGGSSPPPE